MWAGLTDAGREEFEAEAVNDSPLFLQPQYHDGKASQGTL